jgi:hypothetical protein
MYERDFSITLRHLQLTKKRKKLLCIMPKNWEVTKAPESPEKLCYTSESHLPSKMRLSDDGEFKGPMDAFVQHLSKDEYDEMKSQGFDTIPLYLRERLLRNKRRILVLTSRTIGSDNKGTVTEKYSPC